jgi:hypothetical protein
MTMRPSGPAVFEPSAEAVTAARERLRAVGFVLTEELVRDLLRDVIAIEAARLDRRAREAATACLRSIEEAAREALQILTRASAPLPPTRRMPALEARVAPVSPRQDAPVNLTDIVRRRLGEDAPPPVPPQPAPVAPPAPAPAARVRPAPEDELFLPEPRRPVFKRPRR